LVGKFAAYGLLAGLSVLSACSELVGDEPLEVTRIEGGSLSTTLLPIEGRLRAAHILLGPSEQVSVALISPEPEATDDPVVGKVQVVALDPPYAHVEVPERAVAFPASPAHGFCTAQLPSSSGFDLPRYSLHRPGLPEDGPYTALAQPSGKVKLLCGERTLVAFGSSRDNIGIDLVRRQPDGTISHRILPWPLDADPAWDQGPYAYDDSERVLFIMGGDITTRAYYIDTDETVNLGVVYWGATTKSGQLFVDPDGLPLLYDIPSRKSRYLGVRLSADGAVVGTDPDAQAILTCDWDGLRRVPIFAGAGPVAVIDPEPCRPSDWSAAPQKSVLYYVGNQLRQADTSGKSPPVILTNFLGQQLYALCDDGALAYSLDPPERYGRGVGDGYLAGRKFMDRGRDVRFSPDCQHVYFKENAATLRRLGQLRSFHRAATDQTTAFARLADNVGFYNVLDDGRLLLNDNLATVGDHNRISLIDPDKRTTQTLLSGQVALLSLLQVSRTVPTFPADRILLEVDNAEITGPRRMMLIQVPPKAP
jgi:hypothetical protein